MTPHGLKVTRGQERARACGVRIGRPPNAMLTPDIVQRAHAMVAAGMHLRDVATALHIPKSTLHRALHREVAP